MYTFFCLKLTNYLTYLMNVNVHFIDCVNAVKIFIISVYN